RAVDRGAPGTPGRALAQRARRSLQRRDGRADLHVPHALAAAARRGIPSHDAAPDRVDRARSGVRIARRVLGRVQARVRQAALDRAGRGARVRSPVFAILAAVLMSGAAAPPAFDLTPQFKPPAPSTTEQAFTIRLLHSIEGPCVAVDKGSATIVMRREPLE